MKVVNRVKANQDFALTIKNGRSLKTQSYTICYIKNEHAYTRVGISVSKKIGNAVIRNRIKRQIRAMCDSLIDYKLNSLDIVLIVKSGFCERNFHENKQILQDSLGVILGVNK